MITCVDIWSVGTTYR